MLEKTQKNQLVNRFLNSPAKIKFSHLKIPQIKSNEELDLSMAKGFSQIFKESVVMERNRLEKIVDELT